MCFHFSSAIPSYQFEEEDVLMSDQITNYRVPHACACDLFLFVSCKIQKPLCAGFLSDYLSSHSYGSQSK